MGNSGATSFDLLDQLASLQSEPPPNIVLISIGVNDVTALHSSRTWRKNISSLCEQLGALWPEARIVFCGLPPMGQFPLPPQPLRFCLGLRAAYLDGIAAALIDKHAGMLHIPTLIDPGEQEFFPDGFHPSDSAYAGWGEEMARIIVSLYPKLHRSTSQ
jgi:lysophospholipase L1-like esterase